MADSVDLREAWALLRGQSSGIDRQSAEALADRPVANPESAVANPESEAGKLRLLDHVPRAKRMARSTIRTEEALATEFAGLSLITTNGTLQR